MILLSCALFGLLLVVILVGSRTISVALGNGQEIIVSVPTRTTLIAKTKCTISYRGKAGDFGLVELHANTFNRPIIVICPSGSNEVYCLYDCDSQLSLLKIDLSQPFTSIETNTEASLLVISSSFKVEDAQPKDWSAALDYLEHMPEARFNNQSFPTLDLGIFYLHRKPKYLVPRLREQVNG